MCGITGFIGKGNEEVLKQMTLAIKHRGPDDSGTYLDNDNNIALGHARLSILDVSALGHQPMWTEDHKVAVVFNGEIYNFREIRQKLAENFDCKFRSTSDTEIIAYAYRHYGEKCFEMLEGMFAIAIYDAENERLYLVRDRAGKKPLYWGVFGQEILFGSEIKSLMLHPAFQKEIDLDSVNEYLQLDYVPTPHTIWKNVYKLEPASYVLFDLQRIKQHKTILECVERGKFWQPKFETTKTSLEDAMSNLDRMLDAAVRNRLVADVPVGVFLSGGLDSSIVAYYAKKNSRTSVKTFSIGFEEKSFDESAYARQMAKFLGTEHHERIFKSGESLEAVPTILNSLDEPLSDASIVPTYLLSRFAREQVVVALGGDGGDELFAGYPTFQAEKIADYYEKIPKTWHRKIVSPLVNHLPSSPKNFSLDFKIKKFVSAFDHDKKYRHQVWLGTFDAENRKKLFRDDVWQEMARQNSDLEQGIALPRMEKVFDKPLLYQYERTYLMDGVLVKVDRASMLASLEARSPFLDYHLVEFAHSLPYNYKLHGFTTKYILKKMMKDRLPRDIIHRTKKGFGMPVGYWLRGPLKTMLEEMLSREMVNKCGLFNYDFIAKLKDEHYSGRKDHRKPLWNLLVFAVWWRNNFYK